MLDIIKTARITAIPNSIVTTHEYLLQLWHPYRIYPALPDDVIFGSKEEYWWQCRCGNKWIQSLENDDLTCTMCYAKNNIYEIENEISKSKLVKQVIH